MEWLDERWNGNRHFKACRKCVAPKRLLGCHDVCPELAAEKAAYQEIKKSLRHEKEVDAAIKAGANRVNLFYRTNRKGTYHEDHD